MKKSLFLLPLSLLVLTGCGESANTITIAASELPHAKILKEAVAPVLEKQGYSLEVTVLEWSQQNSAVARGEYDANYFQHLPYLQDYNSEADEAERLQMACKVHFEKLCLYAANLDHMSVQNGDRIEIVNDVTNIERALLLLKDNGILSGIKKECYDASGKFTFDVTKPNAQVEFAEAYSNCSLTCIQESNLAVSLVDYHFGVLPGNAALTGLGKDYAKRIVFGEKTSEETLSLRANGIAVLPKNINSEKTKALVDAFATESVAAYIQSTFGESVVYHFENLLA